MAKAGTGPGARETSGQGVGGVGGGAGHDINSGEMGSLWLKSTAQREVSAYKFYPKLSQKLS